MARKYFYNRVYNTKKTIINLVIIGICIIGIIGCFIITSNFQGESHVSKEGMLSIKPEVTIEVNEKYLNEIFFSKIENVDIDSINISYPDDFNISKVGRYEVTIDINGKKYNSLLNVVDTTKPELTVKEITISENISYNAKDFVISCIDNSNKECKISFYANGIDEDGKNVDYSKYKSAGTYAIKISAKDDSGNETIKETKLIINGNDTAAKPNDNEKSNQNITPQNCKYGNNEYEDSYLIAIDITTNGCAVSLDLYKDSTMTASLNKLMETETIKIKKDVEALNLTGTLDGIVGYELRMTVTITNNNESETVADYKVDNIGKRIFITNPHNLSN